MGSWQECAKCTRALQALPIFSLSSSLSRLEPWALLSHIPLLPPHPLPARSLYNHPREELNQRLRISRWAGQGRTMTGGWAAAVEGGAAVLLASHWKP